MTEVEIEALLAIVAIWVAVHAVWLFVPWVFALNRNRGSAPPEVA